MDGHTNPTQCWLSTTTTSTGQPPLAARGAWPQPVQSANQPHAGFSVNAQATYDPQLLTSLLHRLSQSSTGSINVSNPPGTQLPTTLGAPLSYGYRTVPAAPDALGDSSLDSLSALFGISPITTTSAGMWVVRL